MKVIKETGFQEIGRQIALITVLIFVVLVLSAIAAIYSKSPSLMANLASVLFMTPTVLAGLTGYFLGRKGYEKVSTVSVIEAILFSAIGIYFLYNAIWLIYIGFTKKPITTGFEIALTVPIVIIIIAYICSEYIERKIPELYWKSARVVGDRTRGIVSSAGLGIIGPVGPFFGVPILDPFFGIFAVLYSAIELSRTIKEILFVRKKDALLRTLENLTEKTFRAIPAISDTKVEFLDVSGRFILAKVRAFVYEIIGEENVSKICDYMITELIDRLGTTLYVRVEIETTAPREIKIALPISNSKMVADFPGEKILIISTKLPTYDIGGREEIELKFSEFEKIPEARAVELIAKKKVSVIGVKGLSERAENALKHWFIKIIKLESEDLEEALRELKEKLLS